MGTQLHARGRLRRDGNGDVGATAGERILTRGARAQYLKRLAADLGTPPQSEGRTYEAVRIARDSRYRVGRDSAGNAVVLIETTGAVGAAALPDFEGRHLRINHGVHCAITVAGAEVERGRFSVVKCVEADDLLKDRFFDAIETLLRSLGETPATEELRQVIAGLIELFRLATQPSRGTVQGLWAELWLIAESREPEVLLDAWHAEPTDIYDFNGGRERIELKSSGHRVRRHHFSHRQLTPPAGTRVAIGSVFVESSGGSSTVAALVERIRRRVAHPRARRRLEHVVAATLGADWRSGMGAAFDSQLASESLCFFSVDVVPSIPREVPPEVSDIRYVSDLSGAQALTRQEVVEYGELLAATVPAARQLASRRYGSLGL